MLEVRCQRADLDMCGQAVLGEASAIPVCPAANTLPLDGHKYHCLLFKSATKNARMTQNNCRMTREKTAVWVSFQLIMLPHCSYSLKLTSKEITPRL